MTIEATFHGHSSYFAEIRVLITNQRNRECSAIDLRSDSSQQWRENGPISVGKCGYREVVDTVRVHVDKHTAQSMR